MNGRERRSRAPAELTKAMAVLQDVLRSPWCTPGMTKAPRGLLLGGSDHPGREAWLFARRSWYSVRAVTAGRGAANSEPAGKGEERSLLGSARPRLLRHAVLLGEGDERRAVSAQQKAPAQRRRERSAEAGLTVHLCVGAGTLHHETPPYPVSRTRYTPPDLLKVWGHRVVRASKRSIDGHPIPNSTGSAQAVDGPVHATRRADQGSFHGPFALVGKLS